MKAEDPRGPPASGRSGDGRGQRPVAGGRRISSVPIAPSLSWLESVPSAPWTGSGTYGARPHTRGWGLAP